MKHNEYPISVYKKLICDMIQETNDERFVKQIYSIIFMQRKRGITK